MARLLDNLVGHQEIVERLLQSLQRDRLPHSLLFVGPKGVGKKTLALALSQALVCEKSTEACGVCPSCVRVEKKISENVLLIEPERNQIRLEEAQRILEFLRLRCAGRRAVIIDHAELLNLQAANSLLKILEEPPPLVHFILLAPSSAHILSTLRSRSQTVRFAPLNIEDMKKKMSAPDWVLRASLGSFEKLSQLLNSDELEIKNQAAEILKIFLKQPQGYLSSDLRDSFKDRAGSLKLAQYISLYLRDGVVLSMEQPDFIFNVDQKPLLKELSALPRHRLLKMQESSLALESALMQNRDGALAFEEFWIKNQG